MVIRPVLWASLLLTPLLVLPTGQGAAHADDSTDSTPSVGITVRDDGWIEYDSVLEKAGATGRRIHLQGVRNAAGGCTVAGRSSHDAVRVQREEVAYNPTTCEYDMLVVKTARRASPRALAATTYSHHLKTSWIDPINIKITSQSVAIEWTRTALLRTGLKRNSYKGCIGSTCLDRTYIVSGLSGTSTSSTGWTKWAGVHFRNTSFAKWVVAVLGPAGWSACGFPKSSTADFYHDDRVTGRKSGGHAVKWSDSKTGACTNLVHHADAAGSGFKL